MVSWSVREGRVLCLAVALLVPGALAPPSALASEPFGHILLRAEWSDDQAQVPASARRKVRLSVRSLVQLNDAELTVTLPSTLAIKAAEPTWNDKFLAVSASESHRAIRADLNRLDAAKWLNLEFELTLPLEGGGVVSFGVEGRTADGRRVREAIGFAAGDSGSTGVPRLGALEFPATVLPAEDPR